MITSLLVAVIVTPALSMSLLSNASLKRESPIVRGLQRFYNGLLARTVHSPYVALIVAAVFIVGRPDGAAIPRRVIAAFFKAE